MRIAGSGLALSLSLSLSLLALVPFQTPFGSESPLTPVAAGKSASKGRANAPPLRFGIYPGGSMGSVNQTREPLPEDPAKRLAAVRRLGQGLPFVVHLYRSYYGGGRTQARDSGLDGEIREYTDAGIKVELVARYRPNSGSAGAVTGFKKYVRALVARYGSNPDFIGLQVTNEANLRAAPDASDGAYAGAKKALVRGVLAAARETRVRDASQIKIGFNWAWESDRKKRRRFWEGLGRRTGSKFRKAVDWIGVNSYPGTWAPLLASAGPRHRRASRTLSSHIRALRKNLMPRAGLGPRIPLHISENGWPTGRGRSESAQARILKAMVRSVVRAPRRLNISDYRWFDLRDGNSSDPNFEGRYGLTDDRYRPKPAFAAFMGRIAR
jgi:hypothetical protein